MTEEDSHGLKGWWLTDDEKWARRMEQMQARTAQALEKSEYVKKALPARNLPSTFLKCEPKCFICRGTGSYEDSQGHILECPKVTERKRAAGD